MLKLLLSDINAPSVVPDRVMIVDNSRVLDIDTSAYKFQINTYVPSYNVGCATAWNILLKNLLPDDTIILNEDMRLGNQALERMISADGGAIFACGFSAFLLKNSVYQSNGLFDGNIWPVYYEDIDYFNRMMSSACPPRCVHIEGQTTHSGSSNIKSADGEHIARLNVGVVVAGEVGPTGAIPIGRFMRPVQPPACHGVSHASEFRGILGEFASPAVSSSEVDFHAVPF